VGLQFGWVSPTDSPIIQEVGSWIFLLAFVGFFSIEEVLRIKYGDISFHSGYVAINLDISKTDQLRKGNQVVISESS